MNKIKNIFNNFICEKADSIDPYNIIQKEGPWLVGSFVLQKYTQDNWKPNDIDYVVKDKNQYLYLFNFFNKIANLHERTPQRTDTFYFNDHIVQILPARYKDIRLRLDKHDISVCQIGHNGFEYIMSMKCKDHLQKRIFTIDPVYGISTSFYQTEQRIEKYISRGYEQI